MIQTKIIASGKKKTAVARAIITNGEGEITINKENYKILHQLDKLQVEEPLRIAKQILGKTNFNVEIIVRGGGGKSQIGAARLALARAIVEFTKSKELVRAYNNYDKHLLVADIRRKEAYKPGDSKARRKRQKSYR